MGCRLAAASRSTVNVAIRADASSAIGSGHVVRCKALADELRRQGADVRFVCRDASGHLMAQLAAERFAVAALRARASTEGEDATETIAALDGFRPDWLVVDHYGLGEAWESQVGGYAERLFVIDDLAARTHVCHTLLDQNWCDGTIRHLYASLVPASCRRLFGPLYALLHPSFAQLRLGRLPRDGRVRRVLVSFGGADSLDQTTTVLRALRSVNHAELHIDVVVGPANPRAATISAAAAGVRHCTVHRHPSSLAPLLASADLMLASGGMTTWERCCLGVPAIVSAASANQERSTKALAGMGVQQFIGRASQLREEDWVTAVRDALRSPERLSSYSSAALRITDGNGVCRVAAALAGRQPRVVLRKVTAADETLLFDWANDREVRRNSFSPAPIGREEHHGWFRRMVVSASCLQFIGEDAHGFQVGQVRFDLHGGEAVVDISVTAAARGGGFGAAMLRAALDALRTERRCDRVAAEVLNTNVASQKLFTLLGFTAVPSARTDSCRLVLAL